MNKKLKLSLIIGIPALAIIAAALVLFLPGGVLNHPDSSGPTTPDGKPAITLEQYDQVKEGMSYEQAKDILGSDGVLRSEEGEKGTDSHIASYVWYGQNTDDFAAFTFYGNKLASKTQVGLK